MECYESSIEKCAFPQERNRPNTAIYWLVAEQSGEVTVLERRSGCMNSAATFGCGCSKKTIPKENLAKYLEEMHAAGAFNKLALIGSETAVHDLNQLLPQEMIPLIVNVDWWVPAGHEELI